MNNGPGNTDIYTSPEIYRDLHLSFINSYLIHSLHGLDKFKLQPIFLTVLELTMLMRIESYIAYDFDSTHIRNHILSRATFLFSQLSENFTLNYLPRHKNFISSNYSYPDDIDDTFSFFYLLKNLDPELLTAKHLSKLLISLDHVRYQDKPYLFHTWLTDTNSKNWQSIDPIVLSSVAAFFKNYNILGSDLSDYIFDSIINFKEKAFNLTEESIKTSSEFYHSYPVAIYLSTRLIFDKPKSEILAKQIFDKIQRSYHVKSPIYLHFLFAALFHIFKTYPNLTIFNSLRAHNLLKQFYSVTNPYAPIPQISESFPLYIESAKYPIPILQSSVFIDRLITYESRAGYEYFKNTLPIKLSKKEIKIAKIITQDLCADNIYMKYIDSILTESPDRELALSILASELIESKDFKICKDLIISKFSHSQDLKTIPYLRELLQFHLLGLVTYYIFDKIMDGEYTLEYISLHEQLQTIFRRDLRYFSKKKKEVYDGILLQTDLFYACQSDSEDCKVSLKDAYLSHYKKSIGICIVPIILYPDIETELRRFFKHYQLARQILDDFKDHMHDKELRKITTMKSFEDICNNLDTPSIFHAVGEQLQEAKNSIEGICEDILKLLLQYIEELESKIQSFKFELEVLSELKQTISH